MSQESKTTIVEFKPTTIEAIRNIVLWMYNYRQDDFKTAFTNSYLGWDYNWNKLREKFEGGAQKATAIMEVVLNMDQEHL